MAQKKTQRKAASVICAGTSSAECQQSNLKAPDACPEPELTEVDREIIDARHRLPGRTPRPYFAGDEVHSSPGRRDRAPT